MIKKIGDFIDAKIADRLDNSSIKIVGLKDIEIDTDSNEIIGAMLVIDSELRTISIGEYAYIVSNIIDEVKEEFPLMAFGVVELPLARFDSARALALKEITHFWIMHRDW